MERLKMNDKFVSNSGRVYVNVKSVDWENLGKYKFVNQSSHLLGNGIWSSNDDDKGVIILKSTQYKNIGFRLDLEYNNPYIDNESSARLIEELQECQPKIKLTQFPFAVVTRENRVVGEVIPFYSNNLGILDYINQTNDEGILYIYREILIRLKEMYDNGVLYYDIHGGNFVVTNYNSNNPIVNVIDFDHMFLQIDPYYKYYSYGKEYLTRNLGTFKNTIERYMSKDTAKKSLQTLTDEFQKRLVK